MNRPRILNGCRVLPPLDNKPNAAPSRASSPPKRKAAGDRFRLLNAFVDGCLTGLSRVELATWLVLYRDARDGIAAVSEEAIAKRIGCSKRAVTTAIGKLRKAGLLRRVYRGGINRGPSRFRVVAKPPD